jgi:hypothetical protein
MDSMSRCQRWALCGVDRGDVEAFENVQRQQRGDALTVGGTFPDFVAAIIDADGIVPGGFVGGEIVGGHHAAGFLNGVGDDFGDFAFVVGVGPAGGDGFECAGEAGIAEDFAGVGTATVDEKLRAAESCCETARDDAAPAMRGEGGDGETIFGQLDGGGEDVGQLHGAVALDEGAPSAACPGDGDVVGVVFIGDEILFGVDEVLLF